MKRFFSLLALGAIGLAALPAGQVQAQDIPTFASFLYDNGGSTSASNGTYGVTNTNVAGGSLTVVSNGSGPNAALGAPIRFTFNNTPFLANNTLAGVTVNATLQWLNSTATSAATTTGNVIDQNFNLSPAATINIIASENGPGGITTGQILLSMQFNGGLLTGRRGSNSASFLASEATESLTYAAPSGYFDFSMIAGEENMAIGFSGLTKPNAAEPPTGVGTGGLRVNPTNQLIRSFVASGGSGIFSAALAAIPEPTSLAMVGLGLVGVPALAVIRRRRAVR